MNHHHTVFAALALATSAHAGPPKVIEPVNPAPKLLQWDLQERIRWETKDNVFDFNDRTRSINDDNWVLNRFRIGLGVQPTDWLKIYIQAQDAREWLSDRPDIPGVSGAEGDDSVDLRQACVEFSKDAWGLKIGRQTLAFGDQRLIGPLEWTNFTRTFDAARITYKGTGYTVDAFASSVVTIDRGSFNQSDFLNGTETGRDQVFSGLYLNTSRIPIADADLYALHLHEAGGTDFFTVGTRWKSKSAAPAKAGDGKAAVPNVLHSPWDWDAEFAYQFGDLRGSELRAFAGHVAVGYTVPHCPIKSRFGLEYNYASGDDNLFDSRTGTFQNLFPTNHIYYGFMDNFSWQNIHDVAVSWKAKPAATISTRVDYHAFWLANTNDFWYRANGSTAVRPASPFTKALGGNVGQFAGTEVDVVVTWQARKELAIEAGYSRFFAGDFLGDTGAKDDADFGYVQATITF